MEVSDCQDVPPEVLQRVVWHVLTQFLDDVMVGPLALDLSFDATLMSTDDMLYERKTTAMTVQMELFRSLEDPMAQLLRASYKIRHITLEALAKTFNIQYIDLGLGRLEGACPWRTLSLQRYDAWWASHSLEPPPAPLDAPDALSGPPVLAAYLATAVLQREARLVWAFLAAPEHLQEDSARVLGPWQLGIVERWARHATATLAACPEPFPRGALARRVHAAVLDASVAELFGVFVHQLREAARGVRRWQQRAVDAPFGGVAGTWAATLSGMAHNTAEALLRLFQDVPARLEEFDELSGSTTESVDELIGHAKYLALISALSDIADLDVEGLVYERCRSEALSLSTIFSQRLKRLSPQAPLLTHDAGGAAIDVSAVVPEAGG
ncbi:hypothetical protein PsYK624_128970 [Phanerochaete sordida]|uniref:Uncharacterized protein n=1 Tax=Phanerochaete sordida TaxID=48140 RepID=A0A9P3GIT5_9APHY|nr:hypothetical protein PsYK624_128970 [Phanerochaete sordida]